MAWKAKVGLAWHVRWRDARGRRHSRSLGTVTQEAAEAERVRVGIVVEGRQPVRATAPPLEALGRFLESRRVQGARAATLGMLEKRLRPLFTRWAARPLRDWSRAGLEGYIAGQDWSPRTTAMLIGPCRMFVAWAEEAGLECADFVGRLRAPRPQHRERGTWGADQLRALLDASLGTELEVPVHLAALAGLSLGDLRALTWEEIDLATGWIERPRQKTGVPLRVPIPARLRDVLTRHRALAGPVCRTWPVPSQRRRDRRASTGTADERATYRALHDLCDRAGVPRAGFHAARHAYATLLGASGADVATIGRLLGHRRGSVVTLQYLGTDDTRLAAARDLVDRALPPPRAGGAR